MTSLFCIVKIIKGYFTKYEFRKFHHQLFVFVKFIQVKDRNDNFYFQANQLIFC